MDPKLFSASQEGFESFLATVHVPQKVFPWNRDSVGANTGLLPTTHQLTTDEGVCRVAWVVYGRSNF